MDQQQVIDLMKSSKSEAEWNANASKVKKACGGYPTFWFSAINQSGLMSRLIASWSGDAKLHIELVTPGKDR